VLAHQPDSLAVGGSNIGAAWVMAAAASGVGGDQDHADLQRRDDVAV